MVHAEDSRATLAGIELLKELGATERAALEKACRWRRYKAHEQIIDRQSDTSELFFVVEGRVRVVNYSVTGREITLDDVERGNYFGELAAIDGQPRSASVMALSDTYVASLAHETFLEMLRAHPSTALAVMRRLAHIVRSATERIMDLSTLAANNRVQADLLRQAGADSIRGNRAVISPIPLHGDIASRVSTTRETVARVLNDLARKGIVERTKDALVVTDVERLRELVEEVRGE